ncbi:MAG: hypothetical protein V1782_07930 [Pseudomonadota bacterium]
MRANGSVLTGHEIQAIHLDMTAVKEWIRRNRERIAEGCVAAVALAGVGVLGSALLHGLQNYTMAGF